ncbi:MAG: tRNA preQ1(34) S-adenosylmethionine ribosyltransferase-isomerase QueA [Sphaerochaetaceae bacterium]
MKIKEYSFNLPEHLIAQYPTKTRGDSRLLVLDKNSGSFIDSNIQDFPSFLEEGSLIVLNNSKVRKARLFGHSESGSTVEFLFIKEVEKNHWSAVVSKSKRQKVGKNFTFEGNNSSVYEATIAEELNDGLKVVEFKQPIDENFFEECGHIPLPPYIRREDQESDNNRYQTIYAKQIGSVAAPTAGLHFNESVLKKIKQKGIEICEVTLHVGLGTFLPVRSENLEEHKMHFESYYIDQKSAQTINEALKSKRKIVAVGTTSVRTLESAYDDKTKTVLAGSGDTDLFIREPFKFNVVDQLLTNFHIPESTLLVLVSALASKEKILKAYRWAVENEYRFFSYGDAMFIR